MFFYNKKFSIFTKIILLLFLLFAFPKTHSAAVLSPWIPLQNAETELENAKTSVDAWQKALDKCEPTTLDKLMGVEPCLSSQKQAIVDSLKFAQARLKEAQEAYDKLKEEEVPYISSCDDPKSTLKRFKYCPDGKTQYEIDSDTGAKCDRNFTCPGDSATGGDTGNDPTAGFSIDTAEATTPIYTARDFIETLRRHSKFNVKKTEPSASVEQKSFETELTVINKTLGTLSNVQEIIWLAEDVSKLNQTFILDGVAEKISNLVPKVINFQTSGEEGAAMSFSQVKEFVPGFEGNYENYIEETLGKLDKLTTYWKDNNKIKQLLNLIDKESQQIELLYKKALTYKKITSEQAGIEEAYQTADKEIAELKKNLADLKKEYYAQVTKLNSLSYSSNYDLLFDFESISNELAGYRYICLGNSPRNKAAGQGSGVNTEEQLSQVTDYSGQLVDYVSSIRTIDQKTCEMTYDILINTSMLVLKEYKFDPKIREEARSLIEDERAKMEAFMKNGGVPLNDLDGQTSLYPTNKEVADQATEVARNYHLDLIKKLKDSGMDDDTAKALAAKYTAENVIATEGKESEFIAATSPTFDTKSFLASPPDGMAYLDGLIKASQPRNNFYGQILLQNQQRSLMEADFKERALNELNANGGIDGIRECTKEITIGEGDTAKKQCVEYKIKVPATIIARTAEEFATSPIRQGEGADEFGQYNTLKQIPNTVAQLAVYETPKIDYENNGVALESENVSSVDGKTENSFSEVKMSVISKGGTTGGTGSGGNTGGGGGGDQPPSDKPTSPNPTVTQTTRVVNGIKKTTVTWNDSNASGKTTNDWQTYFGTKPEIAKKTGTDLGKSGSFELSQPTPFGFKVGASGGDGRPVNSPQTNYNNVITKTGSNVIQQTSFTPNISGLNQRSYINITIDNKTLAIPVVSADANGDLNDLTPKSITENIRVVLTHPTRGIPGVKIETRNDDTIVISKTVPASSIPTSAVYNMTFKNNVGETQKSVSVAF